MPIYRGKPNVGDLIQLLQLFHDEAADVGCGDLLLRPILQRRFDAIRDCFERGNADRPLLAGFEETGDQLLPFEPLAAAIFLHHHVRNLVDPFVAGEAFAAIEAFATAPYDFPLLALPRIDDLVAEMRAVRTLHAGLPCSVAAFAI